jgi:predicted nuclease of predicted toxin-antitoxin system
VPERIRFLLDEHVPVAVSTGLKQKGIEAATIHDLGRRGLSDSEQVEFAWEQGWVFVTFDSDYLAMARKEIQHSGIVWCAERKYSIGQLVKALALLHAVTDRDTMRNHVEFL